MDDKKKSETLRQREKAQRELIELKKMQAGLKDTEQLRDDDKKIVPKTVEEKWDNFFYHNKFKLFLVAAVAVILTILVVSCATKVHYDATVTIYCYEYVDETTIEDTAKWLEKYHSDTNGNKKTEILCTDCSFATGTDLAETINQRQLKMQAVLNNPEALLFILDEESLKYLNSISDSFTLFEEENIVELGEGYYKALDPDRVSFKDSEKKRFICLRTVDKSAIEGKKAQKYYDDAKKALEEIKKTVTQ